MAQVDNIAAAVAEAQGYFFDQIAAAPLLSLPGIDIRTGVGTERIDLIHPTVNLTAGRKAAGDLASKTTAELFSQNTLDPVQYEEFFEIPLHSIRKNSVGLYGSNGDGAFLESTEWLSEMYTNYLSKLDLQIEDIVQNRLVALGETANSAGTTFDFNRQTAPSLASPSSTALAWTNINNLITFVQTSPEAIKTGGQNKVLITSRGNRDTILRSLAIIDGRQIDAVELEGSINAYQITYTDTMLVGVNGMADDEFLMFDANNLVVKMAADFKSDYFERNDELWVRARVWIDANFGFYNEVTTNLTQ